MRILVTGGAGFIGSHVAEACLAAGHEVAVLDNLSSGKRENVPVAATFFEGSIEDVPFLEKTFADFEPEAICHHAAQPWVMVSLDDPAGDAQLNVIGTINLLELCRKSATPVKFIYVASGGTHYGNPDHLPCTEDMPARCMSFYGLSKETGEAYSWLYAKLFNLPVTVLRYGNVYGPRQNPKGGEVGIFAIFSIHMAAGEAPTIYGDGSQTRDYVYVTDVAAANVAALEKGVGEAYNIGSGFGTATEKAANLVKDAFGFESPLKRSAERPGEIKETYLDISKAKRDLGWEPVMPMEEGVKRTVAWYKKDL